MINGQILAYMHNLLRAMLDKKASDLFISADFAPAMKIDGEMTATTQQKLSGKLTKALADAIMGDKQKAELVVGTGYDFTI